jgi:tetratricopeptide (TPR) repeat protein
MKKTALLLTAILAFSAATLYAQDVKTHFNNGEKLGLQRDFDGAIKEFTEAIKLDPKNAEAYNVRGVTYYYKKDYDRAIADYTEAIKLDPKFALAYYNRGNAYYNKEDYDRAIMDFTEAIRIKPDAVLYKNRGSAYYYKKDYDRAIADFTEVIRLDPKYADAYNDRGSAYYYKKDYDRAIADYEAALRIDPNHTNAKKNLEIAKREAANQNKPTQSTTGVISVTAADLLSAYKLNQFRADSQYKNKTVKVTGKVTWIGKDITGNCIDLDDFVRIYFKSSEMSRVTALDLGQTVTFSGKCDGYSIWVVIKDAVFSN